MVHGVNPISKVEFSDVVVLCRVVLTCRRVWDVTLCNVSDAQAGNVHAAINEVLGAPTLGLEESCGLHFIHMPWILIVWVYY